MENTSKIAVVVIVVLLALCGGIFGFCVGLDTVIDKRVGFSYFDGFWKNDQDFNNATIRLVFQNNNRVRIYTIEIGDDYAETSDLLAFSWFYDKTVGFAFKNYVLDFEEPLFENQTLYRCSIQEDPPVMEIYYDGDSMVFYKKVFDYEAYLKAQEE